jgi:ABC-type nitrate/sulfonate/bicarbonate transport system substrate-binding protein
MLRKITVIKSDEYAKSIIDAIRRPLTSRDQDLKLVSVSRTSRPNKRFMLTCAVMIIVCAALFTAGCRDKADVERDTGKLETIRIGAYKGELATLVWVAESEGFFAKHGLKAQVTGFESGVAAVAALTTGTQDVATAADSVFVSESLGNNSKLGILGVIALSDSIEIIARIDRGISSPADLKGKKIALTSKSPANYFLDRYLLYQHVDPRTVTIVDLPPLKLIEAILNGRVDAAIIWEPYARNIKQKLAGNALSWPAQSDQQFYFLLICGTDFAEKRPEAAKKMFRALTDAEVLVRKDPTRAQQALARRLALDERYLVSVWSKHIIRLSLDQSLFVAMEDQTRHAIARGVAPGGKPLNYLKSIYQEPLAAVRPDAVTLYR